MMVLAEVLPADEPVNVNPVMPERLTALASMFTALKMLFTFMRPVSVATTAEARSAETVLAPGEPTNTKVLVNSETEAKGAETKLTETCALAAAVWAVTWAGVANNNTSTVREPVVKADMTCTPLSTDS